MGEQANAQDLLVYNANPYGASMGTIAGRGESALLSTTLASNAALCNALQIIKDYSTELRELRGQLNDSERENAMLRTVPHWPRIELAETSAPAGSPQTWAEGNQAWQQQQRGPPPAFPPSGPQGYPQHPPQNPNFRHPGAPDPFPPPQQQPSPPQQHQRQGSEQWPGQSAYKTSMAHFKQNSPASWDRANSGSSDTSDEDGLDTEGPMRRGGQKRMQQTKRMEDPNRPDNVGGGSGTLGAGLSVGASVTATAGGTRMAVNFGDDRQAAAPVPPQAMAFNQGPRHAAPSTATPSRGHSPQPPAARRDPSPALGPSPPYVLQQQQPQQAPSPAPVSTDDLLAPPVSALAARFADPRRRSTEASSNEDDDAGSINIGSLSLPPQDKKKKKKHRNPFSIFSSKKK
ncbi:hypothetical protein H1R20_g10070, partial [Candolleomyces eurysporus]